MITNFKFKQFQYEDYGRASLSDGLIFASGTGTGKSLAAITWSVLKVGWDKEASRKAKKLIPKGKILIIALGHLHDQLREEWKRRFGIEPVDLGTQENYLRMRPLPNGFYLTTFTELSGNGVKEMPDPDKLTLNGDDASIDALSAAMHFYSVTFEAAKAHRYMLPGDIEGNVMQKAQDLCRKRFELWNDGVGKVVNGIRCVHSPSLAELCCNDFDVVAIDEATKIKGTDTDMGAGCRLMNPKYRLVLTATPIKNRLVDIFWLAHWAAGGTMEPSARFPYTGEFGEQEKFAGEFMVTERNITKEKEAAAAKGKRDYDPRKSKRRGNPTAEVCNIHKAWKLFAPLILRRRKQDIGEYIVEKTKKIIRVPMGRKQASVYRYHLSANYVTASGEPCPLAQLQALRSAAAAPHSALLRDVDMTGGHVSDNEHTPKMAACMELIAECMTRKEQCVVFSPFHEPLDTISRRLDEAGIPHDVLDGRKSSHHRGKASAKFKGGWGNGHPVLLAGLGAMCEGHSWSKCANAILISFDWAYDRLEQAINRIHRLDSEKDVTVYCIITDGSIDVRLESLLADKQDASDLVLDGVLSSEIASEIDYNEMLRVAKSDFNPNGAIDEESIENQWPSLRQKLCDAYAGKLVVKKEPVTIDVEEFESMEDYRQAELLVF